MIRLNKKLKWHEIFEREDLEISYLDEIIGYSIIESKGLYPSKTANLIIKNKGSFFNHFYAMSFYNMYKYTAIYKKRIYFK